MSKYIFWNIKNKRRNLEILLDYASKNDIDYVMICENGDVDIIEYNGYRRVEHVLNRNDIDVYVRIDNKHVKYIREEVRYCMLKIEDGDDPLIICVVHLNSKLTPECEEFWEADIMSIKDHTKVEEQKYGNKKSILVGDFNFDHYNRVALDYALLNATYFKSSAKNNKTQKHGRFEDMYYNPMLNIYRDSDEENYPKGSYYFHDNMGWHCYDQIFMKEDLIDSFEIDSLKFIDKIFEHKLIKSNKTNSQEYSDHLPLYFEIKEE